MLFYRLCENHQAYIALRAASVFISRFVRTFVLADDVTYAISTLANFLKKEK